MRALTLSVLSGLALLGGLACAPPESAGLVPPTVTEDPALPSLMLRVAGRERRVHVRTFGDSSRHVVLALHGSLADARYLLMLAPLADQHFVVAWDQRGNGLSERLDGADEYTADAIVEEIDAVAEHFSPGRSFGLVGHSFGAMFASLYAGRRPQRVDHLALLEPGGLTGAIFGPTYPSLIRVDPLGPGLNSVFWQNEILSPSTHERLDLRALLLQGRAALGAFDYDFTAGVEQLAGAVLLVGGSCSALGPEYQRQHHLPFFPRGRVVTIEGAGHRLPTEKPDETLAVVRAFLEE